MLIMVIVNHWFSYKGASYAIIEQKQNHFVISQSLVC
jgi:hypothetical protein